MRFLLVNDDGVLAPGLAALAEAVKKLPDVQVTIVAPETEQSQCGHRLTTGTPLLLRQLDDTCFAVNGSPADCVRVALHHLKLQPDWVLSGVNAGGNMGQDLPVSGTVAAAREAVYHGHQAASFSHYIIREIALDWTRVSDWVAELIQTKLLGKCSAKGEFYNFNLPHLEPGPRPLPDVVETRPAASPLPVVFAPQELQSGVTQLLYGGRYQDRGQDPGSDVQACFAGQVSFTTLKIDS